MQIDITRLRRFHSDADAAYAGERAAWQKVLRARDELARAKELLARTGTPDAALRRAQGETNEQFLAAQERQKATVARKTNEARASVKSAEAVLASAVADHERLQRLWTHAARLKSLVREHALQLNALPADLAEEI